MNIVDLVVVVLALVAAVTGYRQGFIAGLAGFVGFVGGAVLAMIFVPPVLTRVGSPTLKPLLTIVAVLAIAGLAQGVFSNLGSRLREVIGPLRTLDSIGGGALSAVAVLLVAWFLAVALVATPNPSLTREIRSSQLLIRIDSVMPQAGRAAFSSVRNLFDQNFFPQVFSGIAVPELISVPPPDGDLATSPIASRVRKSVVEVISDSNKCDQTLTGSGFVYDAGTIMTNAHVVAGADRVAVRVGGAGPELAATVVLFDPRTDVAVLKVQGLDSPPLAFAARTASRSDGAIVIGFPGGGAYTASSARVRNVQTARGADIYDKNSVLRQIYSLRATVRPGNSGGPLLDPNGNVLGVVFAASVDDPQSGFALTSDEVAADAVAGDRARNGVSTGGCA